MNIHDIDPNRPIEELLLTLRMVETTQMHAPGLSFTPMAVLAVRLSNDAAKRA